MTTDIGYKLSKAFWAFHIGAGAYGFTRGLRSNYETSPRKILIPERIMGSVANSIIYFIPLWNLYYLHRLFNRIEIKVRCLNPDDYKYKYKEPFSGYCFHTL